MKGDPSCIWREWRESTDKLWWWVCMSSRESRLVFHVSTWKSYLNGVGWVNYNIFFSLASSPNSAWSLGISTSTAPPEFYQDPKLHFPTDLTNLYHDHFTQFYTQSHSDHKRINLDIPTIKPSPILFPICYPILFLPFQSPNSIFTKLGQFTFLYSFTYSYLQTKNNFTKQY